MAAKHIPGQGDVEITLDGEKKLLKCTYAAFQRINLEIDGGLMNALRRVGSSDIIALESVIAAGIEATPKGRETLGEKIFNSNPSSLNLAVQTYIGNLANGGKKPAPAEDTEGKGQPQGS